MIIDTESLSQEQKSNMDFICSAMASFGLYSFDDKNLNTKENAQMNLLGKSQYVSDATLSFFNKKLIRCHVLSSIHMIVLTRKNYGHHHVYGVALFEITGDIINEDSLVEYDSLKLANVSYEKHKNIFTDPLNMNSIINMTTRHVREYISLMKSRLNSAETHIDGVEL